MSISTPPRGDSPTLPTQRSLGRLGRVGNLCKQELKNTGRPQPFQLDSGRVTRQGAVAKKGYSGGPRWSILQGRTDTHAAVLLELRTGGWRLVNNAMQGSQMSLQQRRRGRDRCSCPAAALCGRAIITSK